MTGRLAVLAADSDRQADGIRDYTSNLVAELQGIQGSDVALFQRTRGGVWTPMPSPRGKADWPMTEAHTMLVQYNPFWYGRRGFAPGLVRDLRRFRAAGRRPTIAVMFHETFVHVKNVRWMLMSSWQRAQLRAIQRLVDVQFCSIERWTELLARRGASPVYHVPVPSNFPDHRADREHARRELIGTSNGQVVLTCFGLDDPGRLKEHVLAAARVVDRAAGQATMLNLGPTKRAATEREAGITIVSPGYLDSDSVARRLAISDLFLAPYEDGASTRRGTIMSALQHAVPLVATDGHLTDDVLRRHAPDALRLTPVTDREAFARQVGVLAREPATRERLGFAGRKLYEDNFDWPVVVDRMLKLIRSHRRA